MKKNIGLLLTICIIITMMSSFSLMVYAESGKCGDNLTWKFEDDGTLIISGTGDMYDYHPWVDSGRYAPPWLRLDIEEVVIEDGVTSIGEYAFYESSSLKNVTIGIEVKNIGDYAFYKCGNLQNIYWNAKKVNDFYVNSNVFKTLGGKENRIRVVFGNEVERVPAYAFYTVYLSDVVLSGGIKEIGENSLDFVTNIMVSEDNLYFSSDNHGVLYDKNKIKLILYPILSTTKEYSIPKGVVEIGYAAFSGAELLESIEIPDSITEIPDYAMCTSGIKNASLKNIKTIGKNAFWNSNIENVIILNEDTKVGDGAFSEAYYLKEVTVGTDISFCCFYGCSVLEKAILLTGVKNIGQKAFFACEQMKFIEIPKSVTAIEWAAFQYCDNLQDVYYEGSEEDWKKINIGELNEWLTNATVHYNCKSSYNYEDGYYTYTISNNQATIIDVDASIEGDVTIPSQLGGYPVVFIGEYAFDKCDKITNLTMPDSIIEIGSYAFADCKGLKNISLSPNIKILQNSIFHSCTSLEEIFIPNGIKVNYLNIQTGTVFSCCDSLKAIYVSEDNTDYMSVDGILFSKDKTELIAYPVGKADVEYSVPKGTNKIGGGAFLGNKNLKSVVLPIGVTEIEAEAFWCENLEEIYLPKTLNAIGGWQYWGSDGYCKLSDIYYEGNESDWNNIDIGIFALTDDVILHYNTLNKKTQSITLENIPAKTYGDVPFALTVTPDVTANLTSFTYDSSDKNVATVDENGNVTIVGAGETIISVTEAGNEEYAKITVTNKLIVNKKPITITSINGDEKTSVLDGVLPIDTEEVKLDYNKLNIELTEVASETTSNIIFTNFVISGDKSVNYIITTENVMGVMLNDNIVSVIITADNGTVTGAGRYIKGSSVTVGATPNSGYNFKGWYVNDKSVAAGTSYTLNADADVELVAKFAKRSSGGGGISSVYVVKFNANNGATVSSQRIKRNGVVKVPNSPTKEGYTFEGWYIDKELSKPYDFDTKVTTGFTLYAKWEDVENSQIILQIGEKEAQVFGEVKRNDVTPKIVKDRTMLPIRFIAEALGAEVEWDDKERKVTIIKEDTEIVIHIDSDKALVSEKTVNLDSAAFIENDRTYLPLRFVAENLGADVEWIEDTQTVIITK